tara:strand:- start:132 stop:422 length:291 start_codon:yes stop_codon:yes gene_type:complete
MAVTRKQRLGHGLSEFGRILGGATQDQELLKLLKGLSGSTDEDDLEQIDKGRDPHFYGENQPGPMSPRLPPAASRNLGGLVPGINPRKLRRRNGPF